MRHLKNKVSIFLRTKWDFSVLERLHEIYIYIYIIFGVDFL